MCSINGQVALLGLKSLFGQASSLLLKQSPNIYNLRLYDENDVSVAHDISVINSACKVEAYQGKNNLNEAIKGSDIVLIGDDILSTPQTCFDVMAPKMQDYAKAIAESSPNAVVIVAASPINKLVPVLSELLLEIGYYDCNKIIGSTAVNNMRANCILSSYVHSQPQKVFLPVIGGDSEETIVPLFSQAKPYFNISEVVMRGLIDEIKQAHSLIYEMKKSSEALNKAYSTTKFLDSVMAGLKGEPNIMNIAFTRTTQVDGIEYCALPVLLGRFGVQARYGIPKILSFENDLVNEAVFNLKKDIDYAKLFCKSRDTAVEHCSRNVANKFQKCKDFEKFVNDLKTNKNENQREDKILNKIKAPMPVESGQLPSQHAREPFDNLSFFLKHQTKDSGKNTLIPTYMKEGASIIPSLPYSFRKESSSVQQVPKSISAQTPICEPIVCPDPPKDKPNNYSNIVSLVETLVKLTAEKMSHEKETDKIMRKNSDRPERFSNPKIYEKILSEDSHAVQFRSTKATSTNKCESQNIRNRNIEKKIHNGNEINTNNEHKSSFKIKNSQSSSDKIFKTPTRNTFKQRNEFTLQSIDPLPSKKTDFNINIKKEKKLCKTDIIKPNYYHKNLWDSKTTKKETNYFLTGNSQCNSRALSAPISNNTERQEGGTNKFRRINRILNLLSDGKPKILVSTKNNSENFRNLKPALADNLVCCNTSQSSEKNMLPADEEASSKKANMHSNLFEKISPSEQSIINDNRTEALENELIEKSFINITKDEKKKYFIDKYTNKESNTKISNILYSASLDRNNFGDGNNKKGFKDTRNISLEKYKNMSKKGNNTYIIYETKNRKPFKPLINKTKKSEISENTMNEKSIFNNFENFCTTKPAFTDNLVSCNTSQLQEKNMLRADEEASSKKANMHSNLFEKISPSERSIINDNRSEALENELKEKSFINISKDEKKKYFIDKYTNKESNMKISNILNSASPYRKNVGDGNNKKGFNDTRNISFEEHKNLSKKGKNTYIIYEAMNRKPFKPLINKTIKSEISENRMNEKSILNKTMNEKNSKFRPQLKNYKSIIKLLNHQNNLSKKDNASPINQMKENEGKKKTESNVSLPVKSTSYNTSENEVKKVNEVPISQCTAPGVLSDYRETTSKEKILNNDTNNKPIVLHLKEGNLISKPTCITERQDGFRPTEICTGTHAIMNGNDINILLQMLDNDVFQCNNGSETSEVKKGWEPKRLENKTDENETSLIIEHKDVENNVLMNPLNQDIMENSSKMKEQLSVVDDKFQTTYKKESAEPTDVKNDNPCQETKSILNHLENHNSSIDVPKVEEKLLSEGNESQLGENQSQYKNLKPVSKVDSSSHNKEPISLTSERHYSMPSKNTNQKLLTEMKESQDKKSYPSHIQQNIDSTWHNREYTSPSSNKQKWKPDKDKCKSQCELKISHSIENQKHINNVKPKSSFTISERSLNKQNYNHRYNAQKIKLKSNGELCSNCKQSLSGAQNSNKTLTSKNDVNKKAFNNFKLQSCDPSEQSNQQTTNNKLKLISSNSKSKGFVSSSKPLINAKFKASNTIKKEKASESFNTLSGQIVKKVNEINENEHSFRIKDRNGMKNFILLRGLLPKIENKYVNRNKQKSLNEKENLSLLKSKVCNDDPFMAINGKSTMRTKTSGVKVTEPNNKSKGLYTIHEENKDSDPLLITHNSVYSRKCPVHGYKYFNKPTPRKDHENKNSSVLSDLWRISSKISSNKRGSSTHRLSQKAPYFKPYSTSAQIGQRSPSRLLLDSRKNATHYIPSKDRHFVTKIAPKPHGFIQKQRITKILEHGVKKMTHPQKSNMQQNAKIQEKECGLYRQKETYKLKDNNNKAQCKFLTEPIVPFHSDVPSRTVKIVEQFFNRGIDSSYVERYLKTPPKYTSGPSPWMPSSNKFIKSGKASISRMETRSFNINWSASAKNNHKFYKKPDSNEDDILVRGTCLEHVKSKYLRNNSDRSPENYDACSNEQSNSPESTSISNAYSQYTKDMMKSEYSKRQKHPSIRQLHESVFRSC